MSKSGIETRSGFRKRVEEKIVLDGVEIGDPKYEGYEGARPGSATGTHRDFVLPSPVYEIGNDQKVPREAHLADHSELLFQTFLVLVRVDRSQRRPCQTPRREPARGELIEVEPGTHSLGNLEVRQAGLTERQLEAASLCDFDAVGQRLRKIGEQFFHLCGGLEVLIVGVIPGAGRIVVSVRPCCMQIRVSCASKSSREMNLTSLLATIGTPDALARLTARARWSFSSARPTRWSSR